MQFYDWHNKSRMAQEHQSDECKLITAIQMKTKKEKISDE